MGWIGVFEYRLIRAGQIIESGQAHNSLTKRGAILLMYKSLSTSSVPILASEGGKINSLGAILALIDGAGFGSLDRADHFDYPGGIPPNTSWTEFVDYIHPLTFRKLPAFPNQIGSGLNTISPTTTLFEMTAPGIIQGVFFTESAIFPGLTDVWASAEFPSPLTVKIGDKLCVDYTATLTIT